MLSIVHLLRYKNNDRLHFIMTKCLEYQFKYLTRQLLTKINKFWALIKPSMFTSCYRKTACWRTVCCWPRWGPMSIGDQSNNHHGLSVFNYILQKNHFTIPSWASVFICWSSKFKLCGEYFWCLGQGLAGLIWARWRWTKTWRRCPPAINTIKLILP